VFEDCLGLGRKNGRSARQRYMAWGVSLVLHGLLVYGLAHARFTIKILNLGTRVQNVRIAPPVRLSVPRIVGAPFRGGTSPEATPEEMASPGRGPGGRRGLGSAPPSPPLTASAAGPPPNVPAQGPVIPSLAAKFRDSLASRYRTGEGSELMIALAPPGTKAAAGTPGKGSAPDFYQFITGSPGLEEGGLGGGSAKGWGGAGGQRAGISIPLKGYNLAPWAQKVLELIVKNWELPWASGLSERTQVRVIVVVRKNGELASIELVEGTARDVLDEAALRAVRESLPFPALPDDFPGDFLEASIEFTYHD
jgi:TonB family protein